MAEPKSTEAETKILFAGRAMGLAENLMLRQMPSEVTPERAQEIVDSAYAFYVRLHETLLEASEALGQDQHPDPPEPIQPGTPPEVQ